jgi:hypothetical protein
VTPGDGGAAFVLFAVGALCFFLVGLTYTLAFIEAHVPGVKSFG